MKKDNEHFPEVNENGSLLNPVTITVCSSCGVQEEGEYRYCPECRSMAVEIIRE
jgi:hypothetical protein